jgi:hypothetical protein
LERVMLPNVVATSVKSGAGVPIARAILIF